MTQGRLDELAAGLPPGSVSYLDREWLKGVGSLVPALSFAPDGEVSWRGRSVGRLADGADPTTVAAAAIVRIARDAAEAASERPHGGVEVVGAGLVAMHVRRLTGDARRSGVAPPEVVVDTTGDPEAIRSALDRVSELGMVVLAGESAGATLDLDLYSSVHRRGLVVVGIAPPLEGFDLAGESDLGEGVLEACLVELADVSSETPVPGDSLWYRFAS